MEEGANHDMEEDGDERRDKRCKLLEELKGDDLMKGREIVFHSQENKTGRGSRDFRNTRVMSRHPAWGLNWHNSCLGHRTLLVQ